jgi:hypothetical protein
MMITTTDDGAMVLSFLVDGEPVVGEIAMGTTAKPKKAPKKPSRVCPETRAILAQVETDDTFMKSCLILIYTRQTDDEQLVRQTKWSNARGFMSSHAVNGSALAQKLTLGQTLTVEEIHKARTIILRYGRQLTEHFHN